MIPNEVYLYIFDTIATPKEHPSHDNLKILSNLSCVCRFFANVCLPRIYERLYFSGSVLRHSPFWTPQGSVLSELIDAEQPLALALAGAVRTCHFMCWNVRDVGSSEGRLYTAAMSHMKNIREIYFLGCSVDKKHWIALAKLLSLEKLDFCECTFPHNPANLKPKIKVKVSRLHLTGCLASGKLIPVIEMRYLHTCFQCYGDLAIANDEQQPWLYQPHLTDLHICLSLDDISEQYPWNLGSVLKDAPRSLETLTFSADVLIARKMATDILETISECRVEWTALSLLRSLTLQLKPRVDDENIEHGIDLTAITKELFQSIDDDLPKVPIFLRRLGPTSSLRHLDYFGTVFRLVDGEWLKGVL